MKYVLVIIYIAGTWETGYTYFEPRIISPHESRADCYRAQGQYIIDHADDKQPESYIVRCQPDGKNLTKTSGG